MKIVSSMSVVENTQKVKVGLVTIAGEPNVALRKYCVWIKSGLMPLRDVQSAVDILLLARKYSSPELVKTLTTFMTQRLAPETFVSREQLYELMKNVCKRCDAAFVDKAFHSLLVKSTHGKDDIAAAYAICDRALLDQSFVLHEVAQDYVLDNEIDKVLAEKRQPLLVQCAKCAADRNAKHTPHRCRCCWMVYTPAADDL